MVETILFTLRVDITACRRRGRCAGEMVVIGHDFIEATCDRNSKMANLRNERSTLYEHRQANVLFLEFGQIKFLLREWKRVFP